MLTILRYEILWHVSGFSEIPSGINSQSPPGYFPQQQGAAPQQGYGQPQGYAQPQGYVQQQSPYAQQPGYGQPMGMMSNTTVVAQGQPQTSVVVGKFFMKHNNWIISSSLV